MSGEMYIILIVVFLVAAGLGSRMSGK